MKKILLIATGGTIASRAGNDGLVPAITSEELLKYVPEIRSFCEVTSTQIFNIDSTNVTPEHWLKIAGTVRENYDKYDGFVVCHGTDTMAYSAAAISYLVQNSPKPIVFTGAQKPIDKEDTDARINLRDSFLYAASDSASDVVIVFQGKVIAGTRAKRLGRRVITLLKAWTFHRLQIFATGKLLIISSIKKTGNRYFTTRLTRA